MLAAAIRVMNVPLFTIHSTGELSESFSTTDSFKTNADLIVEMKKTGGKSFKYEGVAFTLSTGSVTAIYKGKLADKKEIKILETGGVVHHIKYTFEGHEVLKNNDTAIVFLRKYNGPATDEEAYVILGEFQGKFKLDAEGNIIDPHKYLSEPLKSIRSKAELEKLLH